jgi:hypothetical protein
MNEKQPPTRRALRAFLFSRERIVPPHVVHSGRTTENLGERTPRRLAAKGFKLQQRIDRYGRP